MQPELEAIEIPERRNLIMGPELLHFLYPRGICQFLLGQESDNLGFEYVVGAENLVEYLEDS